jgi:protein SMG7
MIGLREAKGLQQGLKEALKTRDPWDKEVEFQRKKSVYRIFRLPETNPISAFVDNTCVSS